jgi:hypothetical protein
MCMGGGGGGKEGLPGFTGKPPRRRTGLSAVKIPVCSRVLASGLYMKKYYPLTARKARDRL